MKACDRAETGALIQVNAGAGGRKIEIPMPELPDVEGFRQLVEATCRGKTIARAEAPDPGILEGITPVTIARRLKGERIATAARHGKHLFVTLTRGAVITMHFGTNGSPRFLEPGAADPPYTRFALGFTGGEHLAYVNPRRIGRVGLAPSADAYIAAAGLGPDALAPQVGAAFLAQAAGRSKRAIKALLMDQAIIAGIGNIYADEILFQAGIHPETPANALSTGEIGGLLRTLRRVLETAIACGAGSEEGAALLPKGFLLPERHRGRRCPRCGGPIATTKQSARTSYFCPRCQKARLPSD
jgi:formamidopyrimidine-DNA glycosylase